MKKEDIDPIEEDPMEEYKVTGPPSLGSDGWDREDDDPCPYFDIIMHTILLSRPFGMIWSGEKMEGFLKKRGYKILRKHYTDPARKRDTYKVAIKPGCVIPDEECSNIRETFDSEMQDIILGWIDKMDKE